MDNTTPPRNSHVIRLNKFQYTAYQQGRLEIRSPENKPLAMIGRNADRMTEDDSIYHLWYHACLLEVLFDQLQEQVKLPQKALDSISTIINRIDTHLKKQMGM
jgi:hypothetical protein